MMEGSQGGNSTPVTYTAEQLNAMTVNEIRTLAAELGYSITATLKADIIAEFLAQQG